MPTIKQPETIAYADRPATLDHERRRKMARSVHAYVRGNTVQFYDWLQRSHKHSLPEGPAIWICGDCHVGNLGPVASSKGKVEFEIRDLDQTVVGNPAHDLIRLALSLAMSARGSDLPGVTTANMLEHMMEGYQAALLHPTSAPSSGTKSSSTKGNSTKDDDLTPIEDVLKTAVRRRWKNLAQERIDDIEPTIPLGRRFWKLSDDERSAIDELFALEGSRKLITQLKGRDDDAKVKVVDAAYWMKGCSSLGKLRYAVLASVGRRSERSYCLVDIKEAVQAAAPASKSKSQSPDALATPKDSAERVVCGARALSPYLGDRMLATTLLRSPAVLRELMPQDLKLEIDTLTCDQAVGAARFLAAVVGKAHGRQMTVAMRRSWSRELDRNRSKSLDAPGWLWQSMLELVAEHEVAYLEHCRRYAAQ